MSFASPTCVAGEAVMERSDRQNEPSGELTTRTLAMPGDANPSGDIFGGWVLSQMDIAAGIAAGARARGRVATVALDAMQFLRPVRVGDVLCVYASLERVGRTSLAIRLEAWALRDRIGAREKVTEGSFTFVALDGEGRPRPVAEAPSEPP
jgi:acyl-CoA thioesterase YciA